MLARDIVRSPLLTEKSNALRASQNQYAFKVHPEANKIQIKKAVEHIFSVNVLSVNTQTVYGKMKRVGRFLGRRSSWKKAVVKLKAGQNIPLFEGA